MTHLLSVHLDNHKKSLTKMLDKGLSQVVCYHNNQVPNVFGDLLTIKLNVCLEPLTILNELSPKQLSRLPETFSVRYILFKLPRGLTNLNTL